LESGHGGDTCGCSKVLVLVNVDLCVCVFFVVGTKKCVCEYVSM
jgi:hypothetical protein